MPRAPKMFSAIQMEIASQRIARLERALKPFADEASVWADGVENKYRPGLTEPGNRIAYSRAKFNLGHLRRARNLLAPISTPNE